MRFWTDAHRRRSMSRSRERCSGRQIIDTEPWMRRWTSATMSIPKSCGRWYRW